MDEASGCGVMEKRSVESLINELEQLDARIYRQQDKLQLLKQRRAELKERMERAKAFQIIGILEDRNLSFEEAIEILRAQPSLKEGEDE